LWTEVVRISYITGRKETSFRLSEQVKSEYFKDYVVSHFGRSTFYLIWDQNGQERDKTTVPSASNTKGYVLGT
jgi:hypothetical protein